MLKRLGIDILKRIHLNIEVTLKYRLSIQVSFDYRSFIISVIEVWISKYRIEPTIATFTVMQMHFHQFCK